MTVTSLDTLQEIVFSKENLRLHTATAEAYQYGSRYYYSLRYRYPDQDQLILGMLNPVDMAQAIAASDGTILGYPPGFVEDHEGTLIPELEVFIKNQLVRWDVQAFGVSDTLYNAAQHAILYLNILPKLLNLRLKRCKTNEAHSFHIREYLASNRGLDRYLPYMTLKQALYFYRNINYIERNAGKAELFDELVAKVLTDRRIPLTEYSIRHLNTFDAKYYPNITARRRPVNPQVNMPEKGYVAIENLFVKEKELAYGNPNYYEADAARDIIRFKNSASAVIQTKDLESSMVDYNDAIPDPLEKVLLRQWGYMANNGMYDVVVNFRDPKSSDMRSMYANDAFIYLHYVALRSIGLELTNIPMYFNLKYRRFPLPTRQELIGVVDSSMKDREAVADALLAAQPKITPCFSTSMFFDMSHQVYEEAKRHWFLMANTHEMERRGQINGMVNKLYADELMVFNTPETSIAQWLSVNNLPEYDYTYEQAKELMAVIFTQATGLTIDSTKLLKNIQKAMIELMGELSSYSVQYIKEINLSNILPLNWSALRVGNLGYRAEGVEYINVIATSLDVKATSKKDYALYTNETNVNDAVFNKVSLSYQVATALNTVYLSKDIRAIDVCFSSFHIKASYDQYDAAVSDKAKFVGMEYYEALTDEQRLQIKSIY